MAEAQNQNKPQETPNKDGKSPEWRSKGTPWIYVALGLGLIFFNAYLLTGSAAQSLGYGQLLEFIKKGYVQEVVLINDREIRGLYTKEAVEGKKVPFEDSQNTSFRESAETARLKFTSTKPLDHELTAFIQTYNEEQKKNGKATMAFSAKREDNLFGQMLGYLFPILLLIGFWVFMMRRMNPGQQVFNIGRNKATLFEGGEQSITFADVAGLSEAKEEVEEVVEFLKDPKKFTKLGGKLPKGVLLVGPPGTGKTMMAKAVAGEAGVPFFSLSGSDFVEMFVGVGAARVRDLFAQAKSKAPCIIFIDEIDAIGRSRSRGQMMGGNDERENTLNQLLVEMDGFNTDKGVIIMAATNRPDILDQALLRPGRFDRQIMIDVPDRKEREQIFKVHTRNITLASDIDVEVLATQTPGFAGADIANICNEAALLAARKNKEAVEMKDFENAIDRIIGGLEKKNKLISPLEKKIVAYHEAGHAVAGWFREFCDPVVKVSIVPRGFAALGYAQYLPEERYIYTQQALEDRMVMAMGGRAAEQLFFGHLSTGAKSDLESITRTAYGMVTDYGMSKEVGHFSYNSAQSAENPWVTKQYSEATAEKIDKEAKSIVDRVFKETLALLTEKKDLMEALAQALLKREVLNQKELEEILGKRPFEKEEHQHGEIISPPIQSGSV